MNIKQWIVENNYRSPYLKYAKNYLSQFGDDGIIEKLVSEFDIISGSRVCVEFGAWDGVYLSNVYNLWKNKNFESVLIEADGEKFNELLQIKNENIEVYNILVSSNPQDPNSLDNILDNSRFTIDNDNFIVLSIDIDGQDYHVWDSVKKYKPLLVVVEIAGGWSIDSDYIGNGASLRSLNFLANSKGYTLVCATGNAYFVRNDRLPELKNYNKNSTINDYYLSDDIVAEVLAKLDENGNITENYRFKEESYLQLVSSEKNKLK